jgi:hypothetical protein
MITLTKDHENNYPDSRVKELIEENKCLSARVAELEENLSGYYLIKPSVNEFGSVVIERCAQLDGSDKWAIRSRGMCMRKDGSMEFEPRPSNRTDEFLERTRWNSMQEAIYFYKSLPGGAS